ncbi:hypothetical protein HK096_001476, partial [Nowakowskiella sp. JEL0078]
MANQKDTKNCGVFVLEFLLRFIDSNGMINEKITEEPILLRKKHLEIIEESMQRKISENNEINKMESIEEITQ